MKTMSKRKSRCGASNRCSASIPKQTPRAKTADQFEEPRSARYDIGEKATVALIESLLGPSPVSLDDLARAAELDIGRVRVAVLLLDVAGRIEHSGGDRVALLPASAEGD